MVNLILIERILTDIKSHVKDLADATDITWEIYKTDKRSRRFVERTLHVLIEACIDVAQHIIADENLREPVVIVTHLPFWLKKIYFDPVILKGLRAWLPFAICWFITMNVWTMKLYTVFSNKIFLTLIYSWRG